MEQIKEINLLINITMTSPYNARVISCICCLRANNKLSVVCVPERGVYFHEEEKKSGKFTLQMYTLSL